MYLKIKAGTGGAAGTTGGSIRQRSSSSVSDLSSQASDEGAEEENLSLSPTEEGKKEDPKKGKKSSSSSQSKSKGEGKGDFQHGKVPKYESEMPKSARRAKSSKDTKKRRGGKKEDDKETKDSFDLSIASHHMSLCSPQRSPRSQGDSPHLSRSESNQTAQHQTTQQQSQSPKQQKSLSPKQPQPPQQQQQSQIPNSGSTASLGISNSKSQQRLSSISPRPTLRAKMEEGASPATPPGLPSEEGSDMRGRQPGGGGFLRLRGADRRSKGSSHLESHEGESGSSGAEGEGGEDHSRKQSHLGNSVPRGSTTPSSYNSPSTPSPGNHPGSNFANLSYPSPGSPHQYSPHVLSPRNIPIQSDLSGSGSNEKLKITTDNHTAMFDSQHHSDTALKGITRIQKNDTYVKMRGGTNRGSKAKGLSATGNTEIDKMRDSLIQLFTQRLDARAPEIRMPMEQMKTEEIEHWYQQCLLPLMKEKEVELLMAPKKERERDVKLLKKGKALLCANVESFIKKIVDIHEGGGRAQSFNSGSSCFPSLQPGELLPTPAFPFTWVEIFHRLMLSTGDVLPESEINDLHGIFSKYIEIMKSGGVDGEDISTNREKQTILALVEQADHFFQTHQLDVTNALIGLAPSDAVLKEPLKVGEKLLSFEELSRLILRWDEEGDMVQRQIRDAAQRLRQQEIHPGAFVVVKHDPEENLHVFGRVVSFDQRAITVTLDPREVQCVTVPIDSVSLFPQSMKNFLETRMEMQKVMTRPIRELFGLVTKQIRSTLIELLSANNERFSAEKVMKLSLAIREKNDQVDTNMPKASSFQDQVYPIELRDDVKETLHMLENRLAQLRKKEDLSILVEVKKRLFEMTRSWTEKLNYGLFSKLFLSETLGEFENCVNRADALTIPDLEYIQFAVEFLDEKIAGEIDKLMKGQRKNDICMWWLGHIDTRVSMFLDLVGYKKTLDSDDYMDNPPEDMLGILNNLKVIQQILDPTNPGVGAQARMFVSGVVTEVYMVINRFLDEVRQIFLLEFGKKPEEVDAEKLKSDPEKRWAHSLLDDMNHVLQMKEMDESIEKERNATTQQRLSLEMSHVVPIAGIVMSHFHMKEVELRTITEMYLQSKKGEKERERGSTRGEKEKEKEKGSKGGEKEKERGSKGGEKEKEKASKAEKEKEKGSKGGEKEKEKGSKGGEKEKEKGSKGGEKEKEKGSKGGEKEKERGSKGGEKEKEKGSKGGEKEGKERGSKGGEKEGKEKGSKGEKEKEKERSSKGGEKEKGGSKGAEKAEKGKEGGEKKEK